VVPGVPVELVVSGSDEQLASDAAPRATSARIEPATNLRVITDLRKPATGRLLVRALRLEIKAQALRGVTAARGRSAILRRS
jgi:hypothetical protein